MNAPHSFPEPKQAGSPPLVTIGLPTYNRPAGLRKALEWIERQTYSNLDIVVSDNCSTNPEVQQITSEFAVKDNRVRVFRQKENIGLENNFNFVYAQSQAPYFIWMSDDDFFEADYVEKCVQFLEQHPDHVLCSGVAKYYTGKDYLFSEPMFRVDQSSIRARIRRYFSGVQKNGNFYGVFRNHLLADIPIRLHVGCDWSFMAKLAVAGKLTYIDSTGYHRSAEGNSQTRKKMVTKFGLKGLKNIFFETYLAYSVAVNIFTDANINRMVSWPGRRLLAVMVFFQINWKLGVKFLRKIFTGK
jgi:glycosyltransferase domain-containing protein